MRYANVEWRDGHLYSKDYDDLYFSVDDGRAESGHVFINANNLKQRFNSHEKFVIAELGFGTGLNFILTAKLWLEQNQPDHCLHYVAIEKHPVAPEILEQLSSQWPDLKKLYDEFLASYALPVEGVHVCRLFGGRVVLYLMYMDVMRALKEMQHKTHAWYLDGFSPSKNTDLWNDDVFQLIANNSRKDTTLSTYSCAGFVRRGLSKAGYTVNKVGGYGKKREMLCATMEIPPPKKTLATEPWYVLPNAEGKTKDAIIIGAGIAGLSTAWALIKRGWNVQIIDRQPCVAGEASGNPVGLVLPRLSLGHSVETEFYSSAFLFAIHCIHEVQEQNDQVFCFGSGVQALFDSERFQKMTNVYELPEAFVKPVATKDIPMYIQTNNNILVEYPKAVWVSPVKMCQAIQDCCGDDLRLVQQDVSGIKYENDRWHIYSKSDELLGESENLILANGVDVNAYSQTSWLPITKVRGQLTELKGNQQSKQITHPVTQESYITPAIDNRHYAGASYSLNDDEFEVRDADNRDNIEKVNGFVPAMFNASDIAGARVAFRATSRDRMPVVGHAPDRSWFNEMYHDLHHGKPASSYSQGEYIPGLYVNAAHGSRGLTSGFISGELIAALINNEPLPVSTSVLNRLNPARFIIKDLKSKT